MKHFLFLSVITLSIFLSSCTTRKVTQSGQLFEKYYSFSKDTSSRILPSLDTNHIYILGVELVKTYLDGKSKLTAPFSNLRNEKGYYYSYLKFFTNGVVYRSNYTLEPFTEKNIYSTEGQYCYYKIVGNEIRLELFDWDLKKFTIMRMQVLPDSLLYYKDKLRIFGGGKSKHNFIYKRSKIVYSKPLMWPK